jgi:hypothetical protein
MALFTSKKRKDALASAPVGGERLYSLGPSPAVISALEAFEQARPIAHAIAASHRLFLVLSGSDLDETGRAGEWQFHYIYSDEHVEAVITVFTEPRSPLAGAAAINETVTKWPPAGSVQETMLQFQGPAARLIVEQQWNDRLERLPGLPETFVDSTLAMATFVESGADIDIQHGGVKLKGRTPPGAYPVWEITSGFNVLQTPFSPR